MASLAAIILAAGEGTRMKSAHPKVLHQLSGRSLLEWVWQSAKAAGAQKQVVVVGHLAERVRAALPDGLQAVTQTKPLGTAHAVRAAHAKVAPLGGDVLVLCGDAPLITPATLRGLWGAHRRQKAAATVLTAEVENPFGYGRVVRDPGDPRRVLQIVEQREATPAQAAIREVNSGAFCFSQKDLWPALARVGNQNRKGEFYLTDVVDLLNRAGKRVAAFAAPCPEEVFGINSRAELAQAHWHLNRRTLERLMAGGVTILEPGQTWIEPGVKIGRDTVILGNTRILGNSRIGTDCRLGPDTLIDSCRLGDQVTVKRSVLEQCGVDDRVKIGPFSHLRRGTRIRTGAYVGNFAEINRSRIGARVKVGHVSYLGDADVADEANIGAGTITANYDGQAKHPTRIGAKAFIGSGTVIVAPAVIGAGALTGAGAVIKRHTRVPANMVAVGVPARVIKRRDR